MSEVRRVMVVSPHPDDAELAMGGLIAKMVSRGVKVKILDLTDGEPTPFGCREIRMNESREAGRVLGCERECLGMKNRELEAGMENRRKVAAKIREFKPDILFGPCLPDNHPDHVEAVKIIEYARFDAKLSKTDMPGESWWVKNYFQYFSVHRAMCDGWSVLVDISRFWKLKLEAIGCYKSQICNLSESNFGVSVKEKTRITNRYLGLGIGVRYGEGFFVKEPGGMPVILNFVN